MGVSKVEFGGKTLVDLTGDTVTPQSLLSGYSAHNKAGELIEGLAVIPTVGNGTITIKQAGAIKGTFTMNQSGNTTIELTDNNTTYSAATQSENGLMTAADKKKLDGIAAGANKTTCTNNLAATVAGTALDAVQGKVLNEKGSQLSVYKGDDGNLHFRNWAGADTAIPFSVPEILIPVIESVSYQPELYVASRCYFEINVKNYKKMTCSSIDNYGGNLTLYLDDIPISLQPGQEALIDGSIFRVNFVKPLNVANPSFVIRNLRFYN